MPLNTEKPPVDCRGRMRDVDGFPSIAGREASAFGDHRIPKGVAVAGKRQGAVPRHGQAADIFGLLKAVQLDAVIALPRKGSEAKLEPAVPVLVEESEEQVRIL